MHVYSFALTAVYLARHLMNLPQLNYSFFWWLVFSFQFSPFQEMLSCAFLRTAPSARSLECLEIIYLRNCWVMAYEYFIMQKLKMSRESMSLGLLNEEAELSGSQGCPMNGSRLLWATGSLRTGAGGLAERHSSVHNSTPHVLSKWQWELLQPMRHTKWWPFRFLVLCT